MSLDDYDRDLEADVRNAYDGGAATERPEGFWRNAQADEDARAERDRPRREAEEAHHAAERDLVVRHQRAERAGGDNWRHAPRREAPAYLDDRGREEWHRENDTRRAWDEAAGRKQERHALERYHGHAAASGTTLDAALDRYVQAEQLLRHDPLLGLSFIARQAGVDPMKVQDYFGAMARAHGPHGFMDGGQRAIADSETGRAAGVMAYQRGAENAIDAAVQQLPNFSSMTNEIAALFESGVVQRTGDPGQDLLNGYHMAASMMHGAGDRRHAAQARHASRSITGSASGDGGWAPQRDRRTGRFKSHAADVEDSVRRAYETAAGR